MKGIAPMTVTSFVFASLERVCRLSAEEATREAAIWLAELVADDNFLESQILPLFDLREEGAEPSMAVLADGGGAYVLRAFHWPVGSATAIHDHGSWAVAGVAMGCLREEGFRRLDDGAHRNHGRLRRLWSRDRRLGQISTLMPYEGGIHRIRNLSTDWAISIHLYGPNFDLGAQDFDPANVDIDER